MPRIASEGSRAHEYTALADLAVHASAVVVAVPTGRESSKPLPEGYGSEGAAPTPYVQMRVTKVLSGTLRPGLIELVSPGIDQNTGKQALGHGGPYLMYITPAMYGPNDPAGGYVVVGGVAGVYGAKGQGSAYLRIDTESPKLPAEITVGQTTLPGPTTSEAELVQEGPS